jgi:hypothetical protein
MPMRTQVATWIQSIEDPGNPWNINPAEALANLRAKSGLDFGNDAEAWRRWAEDNGLYHLSAPKKPDSN